MNKLFNSGLIVFLITPCLFLLAACQVESSTIVALTDSPARLVWVQDLLDNKDVVAKGNHLSLMGYDSEDGKGERVILSGPENFFRPLITPTGRQVVFSEFHQKQVQVVDWSGKKRKLLTKGLALAVWRDPTDDVEWVYIARSPLKNFKAPTFQHLYRIQLKNPSIEELIWDKKPFGDSIHFSQDGRSFSAEIPWPHCAVVDLNKMKARRYGRGCWPALAPDQSHRFWFFDGSHRNLEMVDTRKGTKHRIPLSDAPGIEGNEVYHPRWSNHPRYMVMTGPYSIRKGGNNIRGGGAGVEIYAGRFNKSYTAVESWAQVSNNMRADFYPDMWVARDEQDYRKIVEEELVAKGGVHISEGDSWPIVNDSLLFAWENAAAKNEWGSPAGHLYQAEIAPEGKSRFALNYQMNICQGWFKAKRFSEPSPHEYEALKAISLEFILTIPKLGRKGDIRLVSLGKEEAFQTIIKLEQGHLVLEERQSENRVKTVSLSKILVGDSHIQLQITTSKVSIRVNTEPPTSYRRNVPEIVAWPLLFGDPQGNNRPCSDILLDHIALYGGELKDNEIKQSSQLFHRMQETAKLAPIVARVQLISASDIPLAKDILPYRRGLVVNEYKIIEVVNGEITDPVILVAHWAILNGEVLATAKKTEGEIYELRLDTFENRPELEGERLSMDSDNLLLPMYYNIE